MDIVEEVSTVSDLVDTSSGHIDMRRQQAPHPDDIMTFIQPSYNQGNHLVAITVSNTAILMSQYMFRYNTLIAHNTKISILILTAR